MTRSSSGRLWQQMPVAVRWLFLGDLVSAVGIGLTQPYLVIFLHTVKGVPLVAATAMISLPALAGFAGNWLSGVLADQVGGQRAMTAGLAASVCGLVTVACGDGAPVLAAGVAAVGFGWSVTLPAYSALIAGLVPPGDHQRMFTVQYALLNLGMGAGAAAGALIVHQGARPTLALLWWIAAATCAGAMICVRMSRVTAPAPQEVRLSPATAPAPEGGRVSPATAPPSSAAAEGRPATAGGYREVLTDRALLRVLLAAALTSAAGYGVYEAGLPVLAVVSGAPEAMSWAGVANCVTIVAGLPLTLRVAERLRPRGLLVVTAAVWSAAWLLCAVQAGTHALGPVVTLVLAAALVGLGELFLAGALPTVVNELAVEALRGRYNAVLTMAITSGMWAGPVLTAGASGLGLLPSLFAAAIVLLVAAPVLVPKSPSSS